ncbi:MAG TPA: hypothetical protein VMW18_14315 [Candidatus Binatia bacterium]|nr:hypothetical protein [Candidatus Binatia bacterium]
MAAMTATASVAQEGLEVPRLLANVRAEDVLDQPYAHYATGAAVPAETYAALEADFPSLDMIVEGRAGYTNNQAVRMTVKQVLNDRRISPLWREFFEYHTSAEYWRDVVRLFGDRFRRAFPDLEAEVGRRYEDWRVMPRGFGGDADIHLDCQFVMNTPVTEVSSVKTAHVDLCDKIFSALFYFRDVRDETTGGDLEIYRWRRSPRFIKHRTMDRDIERVKVVDYAANAYACFLNSEQAVHGVSPRGVTQVPRRYINFIAELPIKAFRPKQLNKWQKLWYRNDVAAASQDERY